VGVRLGAVVAVNSGVAVGAATAMETTGTCAEQALKRMLAMTNTGINLIGSHFIIFSFKIELIFGKLPLKQAAIQTLGVNLRDWFENADR
jgi:hypothetical protein